MTIAPVVNMPLSNEPAPAPPTTAAIIRDAVESSDLDGLIAVGLALHLFTEIVDQQVGLGRTDLHRATTMLTKQVSDALVRYDEHDALRHVLRLVTDPEREAHPDGRRAAELCGDAWPAVRHAAYTRAEQSVQGADDYGAVAMLRLAATRAVAQRAPWWGTPAWRARLEQYLLDHATTPVENFTLGTAPEFASEASLLAIVA